MKKSITTTPGLRNKLVIPTFKRKGKISSKTLPKLKIIQETKVVKANRNKNGGKSYA